ncbi:fumarylacetoacetate hydrolase family protein [Chelatococcus sp. GCM10030263]|uniref:fumarylacetoacetate hydrolase family protein n=1 Tax=Chelatococcus sp. GCM10030263 TaxID=3273387 RepID=UPI00361CE046
MPLAIFSQNDGARRLGKVIGDTVVDLSVAAPDLPGDVVGFLAAGERALPVYRSIGADAPGRRALAEVRLHAPVPSPEKYLAIGMNYSDHGAEAKRLGVEVPPWQLWFNKQISCINGPFDDVILPKVSEKTDYEAELAVVIGRACRYISPEEAPAVIGGYMIANDVSARDWQMRTGTMTLGKSFDTHGPIGPWLTLSEEVGDPHALDIRMFVNGEQRQAANTSQLIYNIWEQISYLSQVMTLKPGDILATGTPAGVGVARNPPVFLKPGDVMRVEIAGLGHIENRVVAES